jgi:nicotinamidase/pyrazinamidase
MSTVFLIVDMVNDFISPEGKLYVPKGADVIDPIVRLKAAFRAAGVPVVYDNDAHPKDSKEFATWPPHCIMGRWGSRLIRELAAAPGDIIFHKDSLTFFYNGSAEKLLRGLGANRLFVAGVATDYCVKWCVLDAVARGFAVTVISDAVAGVDLKEGDGERALEAMRLAGASFATTEAVLAGLG